MNFSPLLISLKISLCSLIFTFFIGLFLAYKMHFYKGKLKILFESIIILPLVLPPVVVGFFLLLLLGKQGFIGQILANLNINLIFTWESAVIASILISLPLMYRSVSVSLKGIDYELIEVANLFGATKLQTFKLIIFPLSLDGIINGTIMAFARSFGEFGATLMVAGNIPNKTQTIPTAIYFFASNGDFKTALIWVLIIVFISISFMILANSVKVNK